MEFENMVTAAYQALSRKFSECEDVKSQLIDLFRIGMTDPEWPHSYFRLKNEVVPALIGDNGSSFFFAYILNGAPPVSIEISDTDRRYLDHCRMLFERQFQRAEGFAASPLGLASTSITFNSDTRASTLNLMTNDGHAINISVTPESLAELIRNLLSILPKLEEIHKHKVDRNFLEQVNGFKFYGEKNRTSDPNFVNRQE